MSRKDYNQAIKAADKSLSIDSENGLGHFYKGCANAAKERNATGAARDALNMALSSITTNYYSSSSSNGSLADELTVSALSKEMKDYHIISLEYDEDKNKFEVQFEDKSGNEYSATLSDNFSILDFETE